MAANAMSKVILNLRRTALVQTGAGLTDAELLHQYISRHDNAALETLIRRHGPMVLGVCQRILRNESDAEDAFQATFLVLVRKAATIQSGDGVGNWLYGVAYNTALKAKAMTTKRRVKEREAGQVPKAQAAEDVWKAVQVLLDKELISLPDKYRVPIVLCDLEGKTIKEATRQLGWPQGTVASRLARGRALLAQRLREHGLMLSAGVLTAVLAQGSATASMPSALVLTTLKATSVYAAGKVAVAGVVSAKVVALTEGVIQAMFLTKLKSFLAIALIAVVMMGAGSGVFTQFTSAQETNPPIEATQVEVTQAQPRAAAQAKEDDDPAKLKKEIERLRAELAKTRLELQKSQYENAILKAQSELAKVQAEAARLKVQIDAQKPMDDRPLFTPLTPALPPGNTKTPMTNPPGYAPVAPVPPGSPPGFGSPNKTPPVILPTAPNVPHYSGVKEPSTKSNPEDSPSSQDPIVNSNVPYDPDVKKPTTTLKPEDNPASQNSTAITPDGRRIAVGQNNVVSLIDIQTGKLLFKSTYHVDSVSSLVFSPDGKILASASKLKSVVLVDTMTGKEMRRITFANPITSIRFSADSKKLIVSEGNGIQSEFLMESGKVSREAIEEGAPAK